MTGSPDIITHRDFGKDAAILFIHGYCGHPETTWGSFPRHLMDDERLAGWDVYSLGYKTSLAPDVLRRLWKGNPALDTLGGLLGTTAGLPGDRGPRHGRPRGAARAPGCGLPAAGAARLSFGYTECRAAHGLEGLDDLFSMEGE